jgi:hypothetical protein
MFADLGVSALDPYAVLFDNAGLFYNRNSAAYEAFNSANWDDYDFPMTEIGDTGLYQSDDDVPAGAGFTPNITVRNRTAGTPSPDVAVDPLQGSAWLDWNGTDVVGAANAHLATPAEAAGRPTELNAMLRRVFERTANKRTRNRTTGAYALRNAADSANLETAAQSTASDVDTQTAGS